MDVEQFSIGFLTALVSEVVPCEDVLSARGWAAEVVGGKLADAGITRWSKVVSGRKIIANSMPIGRMGQTVSAIETFGFLERCKPSIVFLTGIAGSLWEDRVLKGDVVVGGSIRWRTQNKISDNGDHDKYRPFDNRLTTSSLPPDASRLLQRKLWDKYPSRSRAEHDLTMWNVHFGEIYTWDYVIDSDRTSRKLNREFPESLCVEMEAGGFLGAIERFRSLKGGRPMKGYVVRGISDYAAKKDKIGPVRIASSRNAAEVAVTLAEWMCSVEGAKITRLWAL